MVRPGGSDGVPRYRAYQTRRRASIGRCTPETGCAGRPSGLLRRRASFHWMSIPTSPPREKSHVPQFHHPPVHRDGRYDALRIETRDIGGPHTFDDSGLPSFKHMTRRLLSPAFAAFSWVGAPQNGQATASFETMRPELRQNSSLALGVRGSIAPGPFGASTSRHATSPLVRMSGSTSNATMPGSGEVHCAGQHKNAVRALGTWRNRSPS
jgi:hypothetical protein